MYSWCTPLHYTTPQDVCQSYATRYLLHCLSVIAMVLPLILWPPSGSTILDTWFNYSWHPVMLSTFYIFQMLLVKLYWTPWHLPYHVTWQDWLKWVKSNLFFCLPISEPTWQHGFNAANCKLIWAIWAIFHRFCRIAPQTPTIDKLKVCCIEIMLQSQFFCI